MRRLLLVAGVVLALWPSTAAADVAGRLFTVAGDAGGGASPRFGALATSGSVHPDAVLALPDGGFAFFDFSRGRVLRVDREGRLHRLVGDGHNGGSGDGGPATEARVWWVDDLALHPKGILLVDSIGGKVRLVRPDGIIVRVAGGGFRNGPGILATHADLFGVNGVAVQADGSILTAEPESDRVRRITPDGRIGPFARIADPSSVAVAPNGTVYVATDGTLRQIPPGGTPSTLVRPFGLEQLDFGPLGLVAASRDGDSDIALVESIAADGTAKRLAGGARLSAFDGDGDSPVGRDLGAEDVSSTPDGGLLISAYGSVRYLAPASPRMLAVAVTRRTLTSPLRLRVSLAVTMPAEVTVRVPGAGIPPVTAAVAAGDTTLDLGHELRPGSYTVRVSARGRDGQVAMDHQVVFPGGVLSRSVARRVAAREVESVRATFDPPPPGHVGRCRRFAAGRTDCRIMLRGRGCREIASIRLHRDGLPYLRTYGESRCRFRRHAPGFDAPASV
jgi:hypothetical protein